MEYFVNKNSIVRKIWGSGDTILFIFAGAAAEFALNKAVDWLYHTGKLPSDPLGRLFSTVSYARQIVFSEEKKANESIDKITGIHKAVESSRGATIPDWAYRDVLFMLIDYSIRGFELMERSLTESEKEETFDVFNRVGKRMNLKGLPANYQDWLVMREDHLKNNLVKSEFTVDLFKQYEKHLGLVRYYLLTESQSLVTPRIVKELLKFKKPFVIKPLLFTYKTSRLLGLNNFLKSMILPSKYKKEILSLDVNR
jgi:hypothetical protein